MPDRTNDAMPQKSPRARPSPFHKKPNAMCHAWCAESLLTRALAQLGEAQALLGQSGYRRAAHGVSQATLKIAGWKAKLTAAIDAAQSVSHKERFRRVTSGQARTVFDAVRDVNSAIHPRPVSEVSETTIHHRNGCSGIPMPDGSPRCGYVECACHGGD